MKIFSRTLALLFICCLLSLPAFAADGETLYTAEYCFSEADFSTEAETLSGIFITQVPSPEIASIRLDSRILRAGDILPAERLDSLRLTPACTESCNAVLLYQPIYGRVLGEKTELTIRIQSGKNETPKAIDLEFETYKNIPNDGKLTGTDPEGAALTFQLVEKPKRGTVRLNTDGSYVYTPDKNKVGEDSFTFTTTDEAGNVSNAATVRIRILKPSDSMSFADLGDGKQFEAVWLCENGLGSGRYIGSALCFCPDETVSRMEFLIMAMELCNFASEENLTPCAFADAQTLPVWQQGYLASAMRRGLVRGEASETGLVFRPKEAITAQEAAVMLQNILSLPVSAAVTDEAFPAWCAQSVQALTEAGISLPNGMLTRMDAAELLYQISKLA